jgi:hypothetical protein
MMKASGGN